MEIKNKRMSLEGPFILVNPERCVGCHTCELECAAAHTKAGNIIGATLEGARLVPRNHVVQVDGVRLSTQCRQCQDAPCVRVCPTGATYRTETYTAVDQRRCIACRLCMMVCPFGAIRVATTEIAGRIKKAAFKCDLCADRPGGPACVEACPTGALSLRYPREVTQQATALSSVLSLGHGGPYSDFQHIDARRSRCQYFQYLPRCRLDRTGNS